MSWILLCSSRELDRGPVGFELPDKAFVGYRTRSGRAVVLSGRCSHLGASLASGTVEGDRIVCPLHAWEYDPSGVCRKIPADGCIPEFARQSSYPVEERGGYVFFFNRPTALYELPFFDGYQPDELLPAGPFDLIAEAPWYFVGANGFDMQHFRMAHDRRLVSEPAITSPSPFARRMVATFEVCGKSWRDRLTRSLFGQHVTMAVTDWSGGLILVKAELPRMTTFGTLSVQPLDARRTRGRVIVWVPRRMMTLFNMVDVRIRRSFICNFLRSDLPRIAGLQYQPGRFIPSDRPLADYFEWLQNVSQSLTLENP